MSRRVLVTGASRGIGLGLAHDFAARGIQLGLCARNRPEPPEGIAAVSQAVDVRRFQHRAVVSQGMHALPVSPRSCPFGPTISAIHLLVVAHLS